MSWNTPAPAFRACSICGITIIRSTFRFWPWPSTSGERVQNSECRMRNARTAASRADSLFPFLYPEFCLPMPPLSQALTVATYVLRQRLRGVQRYPLVLMLEPLFRCNLACAGCGKIQFPAHILRQHLTPQQCWAAAEECGAPIVSIPGGEPLLHPQIDQI